MSSDTHWLIDKSALWRIASSSDASLWFDRVDRGLVRIATPTLLELGYSARSPKDWRHLVQGPPVKLMPLEHLTPQAELRAVQVQGMLASQGHHRAPSIPDLLVAAAAELAGLALLHLDKDFDLIAEITEQPVERLRVA